MENACAADPRIFIDLAHQPRSVFAKRVGSVGVRVAPPPMPSATIGDVGPVHQGRPPEAHVSPKEARVGPPLICLGFQEAQEFWQGKEEDTPWKARTWLAIFGVYKANGSFEEAPCLMREASSHFWDLRERRVYIRVGGGQHRPANAKSRPGGPVRPERRS